MSGPAGDARDVFGWISEMDAASLVMVAEQGLAAPADVAAAARAILAVRTAAEAHDAARPADYLDIQPLLRAEAGPAADVIHIGRSRQDILATVHRLLLRDRLGTVAAALLRLREALLATAAAHQDTLVPAYTNGVQAQPTTFGHIILGYEEALARSTERLSQSFARVNRSPLGAAALATTSHAVDRGRLATLLGFAGPEENAFDAAQLAPIDIGFDTASAAMALALTVSTLVQEIFGQFHHARPWILLDAPGLLTPSTLMPQKRNPVALGRVRLLASEVVGDGVRAALVGHNVAPGVTDYKRYDAADTLERAADMLAELHAVIAGIRLDADAANAELAAEFATASHAAVILERLTGVRSAQAHAVASAIVDDARRDDLGSARLDAVRVQRAFATVTGEELDPVVADAVCAAFAPAEMVAGAKGLGGPQPEEVARMLGVARQRLDADAAAHDAAWAAIAAADAERDAALRTLAD